MTVSELIERLQKIAQHPAAASAEVFVHVGHAQEPIGGLVTLEFESTEVVGIERSGHPIYGYWPTKTIRAVLH